MNDVWHRLKRGQRPDLEAWGERLDLALYQAKARAFGAVRFLENVRRHLGRPPLAQTVIPGGLVRDIALPSFSRSRERKSLFLRTRAQPTSTAGN